MNVHISYKLRRTPDIDREIQHWSEKIQRRLQVFRPELIHLKGLVEQNTAREGTTVSLNLRLPSGQMAAQESAGAAATAIKAAFDGLIAQIGKHKELLRTAHRRRRNLGNGREPAEVPFEETIAAVPIPTATSDDVRVFMNANFVRLGRFVERELFFRENSAEIVPGVLSVEEVVDEVAARALDDRISKPDRMALEAWLYQLALRILDDFSARAANGDSELHLDGVLRRRNERASDEPVMQFHQPDEAMTAESSIPDQRAVSPEDVVYTDEMMSLINFALREVQPEDREAFILHALEGFSISEIASITERKPEQVHQSIRHAREKVRAALPINQSSGKKFPQQTGTR